MNDTRLPPLQDSVALVTGANHGIGFATAVALAERGADVVASYLRTGDPDKIDAFNRARSTDGSAVTAAVEAAGRRCHTIECDLADPATPTRLMDEAERALGPVSVLVHNASGWHKDSFSPDGVDAVGRLGQPVSEETINSQSAHRCSSGSTVDGGVHQTASSAGQHLGEGSLLSHQATDATFPVRFPMAPGRPP